MSLPGFSRQTQLFVMALLELLKSPAVLCGSGVRMESFGLFRILIPGVCALFSLYMTVTAHFPANFFFASRGYRLHQSASESSGNWVRVAGGFWLIASAIRMVSVESDFLLITSIVAGIAGLISLIMSYTR